MTNLNNLLCRMRAVLLGAVVAVAMSSCEAEPVSIERGQHPNEDALDNVYGTVRSSRSAQDEVLVTLRGHDEFDRLFVRLNQAATAPLTATAEADASLVEAYNKANATQYRALPEGSFAFADNGTLAVGVGEKLSSALKVDFFYENLEAGEYLLPVKVNNIPSKDGAPKVLYYVVLVTLPSVGPYELGEEWNTVMYVNTAEMQPQVADYFMVLVRKRVGRVTTTLWEKSVGNIICLYGSSIGYDPASKRALFTPSSDMKYISEHADKYIRPMQEKGRKVLLCIRGGGMGIGPCNMTDAQIADFVAQVRYFVDTYRYDGVNLWDEGASYGMPSMAAVNTTSYPRLIKALDEALPGKLITVVDQDAPTATFNDVAASGGIEVGKHIDFAWRGYVDAEKAAEEVDPWDAANTYGRKPFAGLDKTKYGYWVIPNYTGSWISGMESDLWMLPLQEWGRAPKSNILVFDDIVDRRAMTHEDGSYPIVSAAFGSVYKFFETGATMMVNASRTEPMIMREYHELAKDWK